MVKLDRLGILAAVTAFGLGFSSILGPPNSWFLMAGVLGVVCAGTESMTRSHSHLAQLAFLQRATFWILPVMVILGPALFLLRLAEDQWVIPGIIVTTILLVVVNMAQYLALEGSPTQLPIARFVVHIVSYAVAFALFASFYSVWNPWLPEPVLIGGAAFLLSMELLRDCNVEWRKLFIYAAVCGAVMAETWVGLHFWPLGSLSGGIFLLLWFYLLTGIIQNHLLGRLSKATFVEYGAVVAASYAFLYGWRALAG